MLIGRKRLKSAIKRLCKHWPTFAAMLINLIGILVFASAFFSTDDRMLTESEVTEFRSSLPHRVQEMMAKIEITCSPHYTRSEFSKLVFVVIDALRADFIPSISHGDLFDKDSIPNATMPFLESLIQSNSATPLISEAQTPTVTMPRIKALLSGTYPSFMDLLANLNAAKFGDDNVMEQLYRKGKRIVLFGDDTWLQMFPESMFVRSEGTSSFFATDYTSVDTNVTDRVIPELERLPEWDVMILHYLGLDHIGHSHGGALSKLVRPKLLEMDQIIARIIKSLSSSGQPYLFVLTGDHGMTDAGNHGGSSRQETDTAAVFLNTSSLKSPSSSSLSSSSIPKSKVMQIDMAITLSALLGLPVPEKSRGKVILPVLKSMGVPVRRQLCHMNRNALQMQKMQSPAVRSELNLFSKSLSHHQEYLTTGSQTSASQSLKYYASYIDQVQRSIMSGKSYKSFFSPLSVGIVICLISCVMLILVENHHVHGDGKSILRHLFLRKDTTAIIFVSHLVLQITCLSSTSFVELESFYWHYAISSLVLYHFVFVYMRKSYPRIGSEHGKNISDCSVDKNDTANEVQKNHTSSSHTTPPTASHLRSRSHLNHRNKNRDRRGNQGQEESHYENGESANGSSSSSCSIDRRLQTVVSGDAVDKGIGHNNRHSDHGEEQDDDGRPAGYLFQPLIPPPVIYLCILMLLRISTSWTTVITNAVDPVGRDIRSFLSSEDQKHLLSALVILTFFILTFLTPSTKVGKQHCLLGAGFFFIYLFRTEEGSCTVAGFPVRILPEVGLDFSIPSVIKARIVYILILGIIVDAVLQRLKWISDDFISKYTQEWIPSPVSVASRNEISKLSCLRIFSTALVLTSALLMRVELIPLLGVNVLTEKLIHHVFPVREKSQLLLVIVYLTAGTSAFYAQGNSNSISTIDISSGYIGLQAYHLPIVSLLVVLSTYALFIHWIIMMFVRLQERKQHLQMDDQLRNAVSVMNGILIYRYASMTVFQVIAVILQNHLFIWSVISPKLCYEAAMTMITNILFLLVAVSHAIDHQHRAT